MCFGISMRPRAFAFLKSHFCGICAIMKTNLSPNPDVLSAIREIFERETARFGFESVKVEVANDNDGDPVLQIAVLYGRNGDAVDMQALGSTTSRLREKLLELGEERFPHIRYKFPDDRKVAS